MARRKRNSLSMVTAVAAAVIGGIFLYSRQKKSSLHYVGAPTPPGGDYSFTRRPGYNRKDY